MVLVIPLSTSDHIQTILSEPLSDSDIDAIIEKMKCQNGTDYLIYKTKLTPTRIHFGESKRNGDVLLEGRAGVYIMRLA